MPFSIILAKGMYLEKAKHKRLVLVYQRRCDGAYVALFSDSENWQQQFGFQVTNQYNKQLRLNRLLMNAFG